MSDYANDSKKSTHKGSVFFAVFAAFVAFVACIALSAVFAVLYLQYFDHFRPSFPYGFTSGSEGGDAAVSDSDLLNERVENIVSAMPLEEKVGQLFMIRSSKDSDINEMIRQIRAGGVILFADDFKQKDSAQVLAMVNQMQASSDGKMLVAVDEEGGTVVRVSSNAQLRESKFKSPRQLYAEGGMPLIVSDTDEKCTLLKSLGINMNMAPVADVCDKHSGFMYQRAFGGDAQTTAQYVAAVVDEMRQNSVASCVKHFPGYGNSVGDTHQDIYFNEKTLNELRECDLIPFESAIAHGADSIMLTHTVIEAIDPERPASLSGKVVTMIRSEMGFDGVIVSDGLTMGAVASYNRNSAEVCIMAVNAGVDILCVPKDPMGDYTAVLTAVRSGEIPESRINEAVTRIVKLKVKLGLYEQS